MLLEIYEQAPFTSKVTDLDLMLDYVIENFKKNGVKVVRYDKSLEPEKFEKIKEYALPLVIFNNEIISAGAYDLTSINEKDLKSEKGSIIKSHNCPVKNCQSCPGKQHCNSTKN